MLNGKGCDCSTCIELNRRIEQGAETLERLALQQGTPKHVGVQLELCARTIRRGLNLPTAAHKMAILEDYDILLENVMTSFANRTERATHALN
jgi:hypothetical protein